MESLSNFFYRSENRLNGDNRTLQPEQFADFKEKGVGSYPTTRGVIINGREVDVDPLEGSIMPFISQAYQYRGQTASPKDLAFVVQSVAAGLRREFSNMHIQEIKEACEIGRDGLFGEVYGINAATIMLWVRCYAKEYHAAYVEKFRAAHAPKMLAVRATETPEERAERVRRDEINSLRICYTLWVDLKEGTRKLHIPVTPGHCGHPTWDFDNIPLYKGSRAKLMRELGFEGNDLEEIFKNMYATTGKDVFYISEK